MEDLISRVFCWFCTYYFHNWCVHWSQINNFDRSDYDGWDFMEAADLDAELGFYGNLNAVFDCRHIC